MLFATLDDAALAELDEAASGAGIDIDLLRSTPARVIRAQIEAVREAGRPGARHRDY